MTLGPGGQPGRVGAEEGWELLVFLIFGLMACQLRLRQERRSRKGQGPALPLIPVSLSCFSN